MSDEIERLKKELDEVRRSNKSLWDIYGSELCAGDMINEEKQLEEQIKKLEEK